MNGRDYHFTDEMLFADWEHLAYSSFNEFLEAMNNRIPNEDIGAVYQLIYESDVISRLCIEDIIAPFESEPKLKITVCCHETRKVPNEYFEKARSRYGERSLKTEAMDLYCYRT